jgi:hypothetical protein
VEVVDGIGWKLCSPVLRGLIVYDHGHEVSEGVFVADGAMLGVNTPTAVSPPSVWLRQTPPPQAGRGQGAPHD